MPPEPLPWDRKHFLKERKHERSSESVGPFSRWREAPHHHGSSSSRDFARWGPTEFRSRNPGCKQGGWHLYSEQSGNGLMLAGSCADGKYTRISLDNRDPFSQRDRKGHSWENGASPNGPGRPRDTSIQRSVDDMLTYNSHPHSDFVNTWDPLHFKEQYDKTGSLNGFGTGHSFERENPLGSIDWKPLKWT